MWKVVKSQTTEVELYSPKGDALAPKGASALQECRRKSEHLQSDLKHKETSKLNKHMDTLAPHSV